MKSILVIDDDPGVLVFFQKRLEEAGYQVAVEVSGTMGLEKMHTHLPDLVILDAVMPGMDGLSFVREIHAEAALPKVPVVIVTAYAGMGDLFKIEGVQGFFVKPVDIEMLIGKIRELIGS